ncbi:MAG: RNA polymerase sigma factor [Pirellulales bacterium]|nr:RNA polymerase sigma factor [Pirellulales bacterium]
MVRSRRQQDEHPPLAIGLQLQPVENMSDEELLLEYRATRSQRWFETLVQRYEHELYHYLARYLGDATLAEDVFQATFLQLHRKGEQFEEGRKVRPWLYTIATNQAIDATRREKRHRAVSLNSVTEAHDGEIGAMGDILIGKAQEPSQMMETADSCDWTRGAVANLPDQLRLVVELIYFQQLKYREAADVLSLPLGTVKSRMHTAIIRLNEAWHARTAA